MRKVSIKKAAEEFEGLSEEERRALRISRFHAMPVLSSSSASSSQHSQPRQVQHYSHFFHFLQTEKQSGCFFFFKFKFFFVGGCGAQK
jgi:hypothetical protein